MPARRLTVITLAVLEAATLLSGAAAVTALADRPAAAPRTVETVALAAPATPVTVVRPAAVRRAAAPKPVTRPHVARPHRAVKHRTVRHAVRRTSTTAARPLTFTQALQQALGRVPGYRTGDAQWVVSGAYGHWGAAVLGTGLVYVSPTVPRDKLYDVVAHEWSHVLSVRDYGNDVNAATADLDRVFGGSDLTGVERAADCMAKVLGAHWTHYTSCTNSSWRAAARKLVAHQRLS